MTQISAQIFRILQGPESVWNNHVRKASHGLSFTHQNSLKCSNIIIFIWQSFEKNTENKYFKIAKKVRNRETLEFVLFS